MGAGPTMLTVDVDVLDPAFAPGTGTPEPGGLTSSELLLATRLVGAGVDLVGADVVEVSPIAVASADITALVAERVVREILTGIALRRQRASGLGLPGIAGFLPQARRERATDAEAAGVLRQPRRVAARVRSRLRRAAGREGRRQAS